MREGPFDDLWIQPAAGDAGGALGVALFIWHQLLGNSRQPEPRHAQRFGRDLVAIAGEAGSHCLANTVRDVANNFGDDAYVRRLVLLEDATSPVPGFESLQDDFVREMRGRGMTGWLRVDATPPGAPLPRGSSAPENGGLRPARGGHVLVA